VLGLWVGTNPEADVRACLCVADAGDLDGSAMASLTPVCDLPAGGINGAGSSLPAIALADIEAQILSAYVARANSPTPRHLGDPALHRHEGADQRLIAREFDLLDTMAALLAGLSRARSSCATSGATRRARGASTTMFRMAS
jgi:hypothetical protein